MKTPSARPTHYAVLDGLRGFAALSVVIFHLGHWLHAPGLAANSFLAVEFFFCLSGYVLALAYGNHRKQGLGMASFVRIRLIRLMPLVVLGTLISAAYAGFRLFVSHDLPLLPSLAFATLLGLLNLPNFDAPGPIGGPQIFPLNGPQFTLFLELVANFLWFPIRAWRPLSASLGIAAACWLLILIFGYGGDTAASFWLGLPRVGASFFAGIALFEVEYRYQIAHRLRRLFLPLFVFMVVLFFYPKTAGLPVELVWIGLISPLLVLSGRAVSVSGALQRLCLAAGALSYPIYVLQYPIFCWINGIFQTVLHYRSAAIEAPLIFIVICAAGFAAAYWFDNPVRRALNGPAKKQHATVTALEPS